ncbi:MAG: Holliday junction branch migration protein RuvA [Alphaproteobacteria bacterium]
MIAKLKGIIDTIFDTHIIIDVAGVGYGVIVSQRTISSLKIGETKTLFIETIVREDSITLYGFTTQTEQEFFNLLTTVQGIGPKASLSILSALTPNQISTAILSGDSKSFASANGIGKKTAERIIAELKDKITKVNINMELSEITKTAKPNTIAEDAISALSNLGFTRSQSFETVMKIINKNPNIDMNELIKLALKEINNF